MITVGFPERIKVKEDTFPLVNPSCKLNNAFLGSGIYGKLFRVFNKKKKSQNTKSKFTLVQ